MNLEEHLQKINRAVLLGIVILLLAAVFVPMGRARLVDGDEGFSIMAAKLVNQGRAPYIDFFYQQMFLHPYAYALWLRIFGTTWYAARSLSVCLAILLGVLVYFHALRVTGRQTLGLLAAALFAFAGSGAGWFTVVKTFALSTLFLFGAYAMVFTGASPRWRCFVSGLFLGLAVDVRLHIIAAFPAFAIQFLGADEPVRRRFEHLLWFTLGLGAALLPGLYFLARSPIPFVFDNFTYHSLRSGHGLIGGLPQKWAIALQLLALRGHEGSASIQFVISLLFTVGLGVLTTARRERLPLSVWITFLLMIVSFLPTPTFTQYFTVLVPFMVINIILVFASLKDETRVPASVRRRLRIPLAAACALYILVWPYDYDRYGTWGHHIPGFLSRVWDVNWEIPVINRVSAAIDQYADSTNPTAISWWPGYFVESRTAPFPRTENNWGRDVWFRMSPGLRARCHVISDPGLDGVIQQRAAPLAVLGNWSWDIVWEPGKSRHRNTLVKSGYVMIGQVASTEIYQWQDTAFRAAQQQVTDYVGSALAIAPDNDYQIVILPLRTVLPAGLDSAAYHVTDYSELSSELFANQDSLDDYLPALAAWVVNDDRPHVPAFDYMNDLESFITGAYKFTLLAVMSDRTGALYDIRRVEPGDVRRASPPGTSP